MSFTTSFQRGSRSAGKLIGRNVFFAMMMIINAAFTFAFGWNHGAEIIQTGFAPLSRLLGGIILLGLFDYGALGWDRARRSHDNSPKQNAVAQIMAVACIVASTLVSAIQLGLSTTIVDLTGLHEYIGVGGLALMVIMAAAHFACVFYYRDQSFANQEAEATSEEKAQINQMRIDQKARIQEKTIGRIEQLLDGKVEQIAMREADIITREFLTEFNQLEEDKPAASPTEKRGYSREELEAMIAAGVAAALPQKKEKSKKKRKPKKGKKRLDPNTGSIVGEGNRSLKDKASTAEEPEPEDPAPVEAEATADAPGAEAIEIGSLGKEAKA